MALHRIGLAALLMVGITASAMAQVGTGSSVVVGTTATTGYIYGLDARGVSTNAPVSADATHTFTGLDSAGNQQSMNFSSSATAQSNFGQLHVYTTATVSNAYYNAANPLFSNSNGGLNDPNGSPGGLVSLGFATFDDTLQFGGTALQSGYKARYIFHVDGTNTGTGALADLGVRVDGNPDDAFFAADPGFFVADWATHDFDINGITPQNLHVQFSDQVVLNLFDLPEGASYSGTSDFSSTLTLSAIEVVDSSGALASGWTVTSGSGTVYNAIQGSVVPEANTAALLGLALPMIGAVVVAQRKKK